MEAVRWVGGGVSQRRCCQVTHTSPLAMALVISTDKPPRPDSVAWR